LSFDVNKAFLDVVDYDSEDIEESSKNRGQQRFQGPLLIEVNAILGRTINFKKLTKKKKKRSLHLKPTMYTNIAFSVK